MFQEVEAPRVLENWHLMVARLSAVCFGRLYPTIYPCYSFFRGWVDPRAIVRPEGILTYLLTPWCRVLLEKLTGLELVKKFPSFHGTRRFITALTSVRHLSLSWAAPFQSIYQHHASWISILILSTHLRPSLPSGLLPSGFPSKTSMKNSSDTIGNQTRHLPACSVVPQPTASPRVLCL